ncbi:MAG: cell division protein FtsA [Fusobacteriaceae bacterium]
MEKNKTIMKTIVDIGNSRIRVLTGELSEDTEEIKVIGYSESSTLGLKKSVVENPENLTNSIKTAIFDAENKMDLKIESVIAGISSPNIKSRTINKKIIFSECEIGESEIEELFLEAEKELLPKDERVIKKELYNIRVDNSGIIKNPSGIVGKEIQADIHMICINELDYISYEEVINRAGLTLEKLVLNSYGSSESVLNEEEKNMGVALIDIGEGITDILMFKNGKLIYSKSIPLGGMHYINDISYILEIPKEEAFDILKKLKNKNVLDEKILTESGKAFTIQYIKTIIDARTEDIVKFIVQTIEESGFNGYLGKGIVITGGAVVLEELIKKIALETGYKVTKKSPEPMKGLEKTEPSMASIVGILIETVRDEEKKIRENEIKEQKYMEIKEKKNKEIEELSELLDDDCTERNKKEKKESIFKPIVDWLSNYI